MKKEKEQSVFKSVKNKISITIGKLHTPKEFFKDREGLSVWSSFVDNVVNKAKQTKEKTQFNISSFDLLQTSTDEVIEKSLFKKHLFSDTEVCAIISHLIQKQSKGQTGVLINTGYANLFYTKSRVVSVGWGGSRWGVDDWSRDGDGWDSGGRVFSPATDGK